MKKLFYLFTIFALLITGIPVGANDYATVFNPITEHRKAVEIGDKHAFDNGYILEISDGYIEQDPNMLGYSVVSDYQTTLSSSMTKTQSTIAVSSMATTDSHTLVMTDLGDKVFLTIEPASSSKKEIVMCTGISGSTWTGCTRGLAFYGTSTSSVSANCEKHSAGSIIIISNVHYVYEQLVDKDTTETITGDKTYSGSIDFSVNLPTIPTVTPTSSDQVASKLYVDDVGAGGLTASNIGDGNTLRANGTSPETLDIATSTSEMASFDIEGGYFVVSTTTDEKIDTHWNDRYNATTTKSGDFTFSDSLTVGSSSVLTGENSGFYGDGSDGATTTPYFYENKIWNFTSLTITANTTSTTSLSDEIIYVRVQGDCNIAGGINLVSGGADGATGVGAGNGVIGNDSQYIDWNANALSSACSGNGCSGAGAGGYFANINGTYEAATSTNYMLFTGNFIVIPGAGGAAGGGQSATVIGGNGGDGSASIMIFCGGDVSFTGNIDISGSNGVQPTGADCDETHYGGGGGGGAGGSALILGRGTITDSGSKNYSGGTGATKGSCGYGNSGTDGSNGLIIIDKSPY